jgi:hypothetical protein
MTCRIVKASTLIQLDQGWSGGHPGLSGVGSARSVGGCKDGCGLTS